MNKQTTIFRKKFKGWLVSNNKTLLEFCSENGFGRPAVAKWICGENVPSKGNMERLVLATNGYITPNDFFIIESIETQKLNQTHNATLNTAP